MEERISHLMKALDISREEALNVIQADISIDKGADPFPLTKEQKEAEKKARGTGTRTVYNFQKKERKADNDKREILGLLLDRLDEYNPQIVNPEREFTFTYNDKKYKIVLSVPRK